MMGAYAARQTAAIPRVQTIVHSHVSSPRLNVSRNTRSAVTRTHLIQQAVLNATCAMQVGRNHFRAESLECLKRQTSTGLLSRSALAVGLCESGEWVNHRGELCLGSAPKTLPVLCDRLNLALLASRRALGGSAGHRESRPVDGPVPDLALRCSLADLGTLSLRLVSSVEDRRRWVAMMEAHHPQGWSQPPGFRFATGSSPAGTERWGHELLCG